MYRSSGSTARSCPHPAHLVGDAGHEPNPSNMTPALSGDLVSDDIHRATGHDRDRSSGALLDRRQEREARHQLPVSADVR